MFSLVYNHLKLRICVFWLPKNEPLISDGAGPLPSSTRFYHHSTVAQKGQTKHSRLISPARSQDKMLAGNFSANHRHTHICKHHTHRIYISVKLYQRKWSYRREGYQASDRSPRLHFNIFIISNKTLDISRRVCGDQNRYFKPKLDLFETVTKCFLYLNLIRSSSLRCHNIKK